MIKKTSEKEILKAPWRKFEDFPVYDIKCSTGSMYDAVVEACSKYPNRSALKFMKKVITFAQMLKNIDLCAEALISHGVKKGDFVTIACPNCIEAVYCIYAVNKIGAICNMIHPLSSPVEIKYFLNKVDSTTIVIFDTFFENFEKIWSDTKVNLAIIVDISYDLSLTEKIVYKLKTKKTKPKIKYSSRLLNFNKIINESKKTNGKNSVEYDYPEITGDDISIILYSGGTTGNPKGIALTNSNFNTLAKQVLICVPSIVEEGTKILGIMPLFHGFGLGLFTHALMANGATCVLVARFTPKSFEKTLYSEKCNYLAGVPTLFEEWVKMKNLEGKDYSFIKGIFCGGDKLTQEQKVRFNKFLADHNCNAKIREGYGVTETVTCCCLMPENTHKPNSIGVPLPNMYMKIVDRDTHEEKQPGEEGEIVVNGPLIMKGYYKDKKATDKVLHVHNDGHLWLHTGDAGIMDEDGYFYFKGRYKRIIVSSGYSVYPNALEEIINTHKYIRECCVIGLPDQRRGHKIVVVVELDKNISESNDIKDELMTFFKENIGKHQLPRDIKFINQMPTTKVGKVDYRLLETEYAN